MPVKFKNYLDNTRIITLYTNPTQYQFQFQPVNSGISYSRIGYSRNNQITLELLLCLPIHVSTNVPKFPGHIYIAPRLPSRDLALARTDIQAYIIYIRSFDLLSYRWLELRKQLPGLITNNIQTIQAVSQKGRMENSVNEQQQLFGKCQCSRVENKFIAQ